MKFKWSIGLLFLALLVSCKTLKQNQKQQSNPEVQAGVPGDTILFLVFNIQQDMVIGQPVVHLIKTIKSPGTLKMNETDLHLPNYLSIYILNGEKIEDSIILEHPLQKQVEFTDEKNGLISKEVKQDKAEFFIRLQKKTSYNRLQIFETIKGNRVELNTIKLF